MTQFDYLAGKVAIEAAIAREVANAERVLQNESLFEASVVDVSKRILQQHEGKSK
jgi:hypothetical protein